MKLQLAYDLGTYEELYPFMEEIEEAVDIIEIGTPVILREGVSQIENVKRRFPDNLIFADLKIMDAGNSKQTSVFRPGQIWFLFWDWPPKRQLRLQKILRFSGTVKS